MDNPTSEANEPQTAGGPTPGDEHFGEIIIHLPDRDAEVEFTEADGLLLSSAILVALEVLTKSPALIAFASMSPSVARNFSAAVLRTPWLGMGSDDTEDHRAVFNDSIKRLASIGQAFTAALKATYPPDGVLPGEQVAGDVELSSLAEALLGKPIPPTVS